MKNNSAVYTYTRIFKHLGIYALWMHTVVKTIKGDTIFAPITRATDINSEKWKWTPIIWSSKTKLIMGIGDRM